MIKASPSPYANPYNRFPPPPPGSGAPFRDFLNHFWVKLLEIFDADSGMKKFGSTGWKKIEAGIRYQENSPDPQQ